MRKGSIMHKFKGNLIVSCQALPEEPLHSSFIMSKMALAAAMGGAQGIRANTVEDICAIKAEVDLPVIGIISAYFTLNEPITMQKIISGIFIIFGVYVTTHSHKFVKNAH